MKISDCSFQVEKYKSEKFKDTLDRLDANADSEHAQKIKAISKPHLRNRHYIAMLLSYPMIACL